MFLVKSITRRQSVCVFMRRNNEYLHTYKILNLHNYYTLV